MLAGPCPPIDWSIAFCHAYRRAPYARERSTNDKALAILLRYMVTVLNTPDIYASSEARRGEKTRVSGQRPEQGPMPRFLRSRKRGHKALTLHSEFLSLPRCWRNDLPVSTPVVAFWFACRSACRCRLLEIDSTVSTPVVSPVVAIHAVGMLRCEQAHT